MRCCRRSAPISTRSSANGQPKPQIAIKYASRKLDGVPLPRAALRDLRLFAARRRRASALRQGRARRHPLVRPAAGLPHRGARSGQGAAGQERRDRAGRRQGRLRAEEVCRHHAAAARARRCRPKASPPTSCSSRRCSTSPTISATDGVIPPDNVVRHDGDDPYLVVAADKGTATFSDIANAISAEHDFWLDDAFASGGSAGYDHKKMGITARGAWESVKRHFREMDVDIDATPFTVVGVGDMSGDVFGNGMLREEHDQARRGLRPSRHLHRSRSRSGQELRRAAAAVRPAALELAGLRQGADLGGRRRVLALAEGDRLSPAGTCGDRLRQAEGHARRDHERHPQGAGRSVVLRRHRHLCARVDRDRRRGRRPRQRCDPRRPATICAAR